MNLDQFWIPETTIFMMGCRAWVAADGGRSVKDEATSQRVGREVFRADKVLDPSRCPVCKGGIRPGHDTRSCGRCDSLSPRREAQVTAARIGVDARDRSEQAERKVKNQLRPLAAMKLSERHRRWIWNGCIGQIVRERENVTNEAKLGRDFLISINQCPNWNLILDRRGKVVGRYDEDLCP